MKGIIKKQIRVHLSLLHLRSLAILFISITVLSACGYGDLSGGTSDSSGGDRSSPDNDTGDCLSIGDSNSANCSGNTTNPDNGNGDSNTTNPSEPDNGNGDSNTTNPSDRGDYSITTNPSDPDDGDNGGGDNPDTLLDSDNDGYLDAYDVDYDGNGLIDIFTTTTLLMVHSDLTGSSLAGNTSGCGDGYDITECTGYELQADLDLNDINSDESVSNWERIGDCDGGKSNNGKGKGNDKDKDCEASGAFSATFNGNNHTIGNLRMYATEDMEAVGFFGAITPEAQLHDIHIHNVTINTTITTGKKIEVDNVGGLVGYAKGALINASSVIGQYINGHENVGGLVGHAEEAKILASYTQIDNLHGKDAHIGGLAGKAENAIIHSSAVVIESMSADEDIGGLVGDGEDALITSSTAVVGDLVSNGKDTGGLIGHGVDAVIRSSSAIVDQITASGNSAGGLVGHAKDAIIISSSAIAGQITSSGKDVGGLLGDGKEASVQASTAIVRGITSSGGSVGGLSGDATNSAVSSSSAIVGQITSSGKDAGGLVGKGSAVRIDRSYAAINGIDSPNGLGGLVGSKKNSNGNSQRNIRSSYWDNSRLGIFSILIVSPTSNGSGKSTAALQGPAKRNGFSGIYFDWRSSRCHPTTGEYLLSDTNPGNGYVDAWDLGTSTQYPTLGCLRKFNPAQQHTLMDSVLAEQPQGLAPDIRNSWSNLWRNRYDWCPNNACKLHGDLNKIWSR